MSYVDVDGEKLSREQCVLIYLMGELENLIERGWLQAGLELEPKARNLLSRLESIGFSITHEERHRGVLALCGDGAETVIRLLEIAESES